MSKFDLRKFARELNDTSRSHPIGALQEIRAKLHGKRKAGQNIFSKQTISKEWACHHGGRSELQFNIGFDGTKGKELRSGVAFSFKTSRSLPNIEPLIDKVRLFNAFLRRNTDLYDDMKMWYWRDGKRYSLVVGPIARELAAKDVFVFLGYRRPVSKLPHDTVLNDMDRLLPLYEYIESGGRAGVFSNREEKREARNGGHGGSGKLLSTFDEAERNSVQKSSTIVYRNRHNKMTNAIKKLFRKYVVTQGTDQDCRYDVLIKDYDGKGRDLLTEVKPEPDKGSIRIAIGQLLDYRRFLPHRTGTDLAVLTISRPARTYVDLLLDLQISPLWFADESCKHLRGEGKAWRGIKANSKGDPVIC